MRNTEKISSKIISGKNKSKQNMTKDEMSDLEYDAAMLLEDYIFLDKQMLNLAVTKKYLGSDAQLANGLIGHKHFSLIDMPAPGREDGPVFIKAGGYQKDGSFGWCYALLWKQRAIICNDIALNGSKITFLKPTVRYCSTYRDMMNTTDVSKSVVLSLGEEAIENIKMACDHWDQLFCLKSDVLSFQKGQNKKSLNFEKVTSGVWGRNLHDIGGIDDLIDVSFYWQYPVEYHRKVWWTIG